MKQLFRNTGTSGLVFLMALLFACKPSQKAISDYRFFEKNLDSLSKTVLSLKPPVIQNHDQLSINVSSASLDQTQTAVFNLLTSSAGSSGGGTGSMGYLVDYDGNISLPVIGKVKAAGLNKEMLSDTLVSRLNPYVKNPVINIHFLNFRVMLMGEVGKNGWMNISNEKATIVDVIGEAGGLSDQGMRTDVLLIRTQPNGQVETHRMDLNDAMVFRSPYFQLQQNDVIYVLPNDSKLIQYQRSNSPFFRDLPVYLALITSILAFGTLIISLTN
ncbi:MAG TPA: polysaccharide biosynthesis/export family protein [Phnomibacter sp.]|nr:polysaccharide biosynthesis/export family protein [Phnomibacter sp.]